MNYQYDPGDGPIVKIFCVGFLGIGVFILLWLWRGSASEAALIEVIGIGLALAIYLGVWVYGQMTDNRVKIMSIKQQNSPPAPPTTDDVITTNYRFIPASRSYPAQPFQSKQESEIIWDFDAQGKRIEASRRAVEHFIDVCYPVCKRDNWTGNGIEDKQYGPVAKFLCSIQGAPLLPSGKGYAWRAGVTREDLQTWLYQCTRRSTTTLPQDEAI